MNPSVPGTVGHAAWYDRAEKKYGCQSSFFSVILDLCIGSYLPLEGVHFYDGGGVLLEAWPSNE